MVTDWSSYSAEAFQCPLESTVISPIPCMISSLPAGISYPELELLHHYANCTAKTMGPRPFIPNGRFWEIAVPQAAQSHPFLIHNVLAVSAIHLAYLHPAERASHYEVGMSHYTKALALFRPSAADIAPSNVHAAVASAILVFVVFMALPGASGNSPDGSLASLLAPLTVLQRSTAWFSTVCKEAAERSPIAFEYPVKSALSVADPVARQALDALRYFNHSSKDTNEQKSIYEKAICQLEVSFAITTTRPNNWSRMLFWARTISPEFAGLLQHGRPMALILVAYWCVPIHHAPYVWFIGRWPEKVIKAVASLLDDEWKLAMQWPLAEVGAFGISGNNNLPKTPPPGSYTLLSTISANFAV